MITAAHLLYPLRFETQQLERLLSRIGAQTGATPATAELADAIRTLEHAYGIARAMTPFNPEGL